MEVVLDEFVIDEAVSPQSSGGRAIEILSLIQEICHVVVVTPGLLSRYRRKLKGYESSMGALSREFGPLKVFAQFLANSDKTHHEDDPGNLEELAEVNSDDREIVAAALATESEKVIISTDTDLFSELESKSFTERHEWRLLPAGDAVEWLSSKTSTR